MLTNQWTTDPENVLRGQGRDVSNDIPDLVTVDAGGSTGEGLKVQTGHRHSPCMMCLLLKTIGLLQWSIFSLLRNCL